jgi:hypothetical protein
VAPIGHSVWRKYYSGYQNRGNVNVNHYHAEGAPWYNMELCHDHFLDFDEYWNTEKDCKWRHSHITCDEQQNMKPEFIAKLQAIQEQREEVDDTTGTTGAKVDVILSPRSLL